MARQSDEDRARQMFRDGASDADVVAALLTAKDDEIERQVLHKWVWHIRHEMRREQEHLDLNRREF